MPDRTCSVDGCERPVRCIGLCGTHYSRLQHHKHKKLVECPPRPCAYCGEIFTPAPGASRQKYCSVACRSRAGAVTERTARQEARAVTHCLWCGADIRHMRADAKFCSDFCSNRCDYRDNRERIDAAAKQYVENNPDKILSANRRYRESNRERIYTRQKAWQEANREHHQNYQREYGRSWAKENPDKIRLGTRTRRERIKTNGGGACEITARDWERLLLRYDYGCAYCGVDLKGNYQRDHIIPISRGGRDTIGNIVPTCQPCNSQKADRLVMEWRLGIFYRRKKQSD